MSIAEADIVVLDTNVLIHWIRQDSIGQYLLHHYELEKRVDRPLVPSTVAGEIKGLARCNGWERKKLDKLDELLSELVMIEVGLTEIVESYAKIYELDRSGGHRTGQNDMWIAAASKAVGGVLMTCDGDFSWMNPSVLRIEHVAPQE